MINELILEIQLSAGSDAMTTFQQWVRLLLSAGTLLVGTAASAAVLGPGQTLAPGQRLYSADNAYFAALSADGDFSVYRSADGARAWSTGTRGSRAVIATMLRDGQFVLLTSDGTPVWATPTRGRHRIFGVTVWGTATVINARKWKPRKKKAEPIVEQILRRRGLIHWQSTSFDKPPKYRQRT